MSPGRIALGYALVATLWIAFSDAVVARLELDPPVATIKGTAFVFVTASLLYFTIRRLVQALQATSRERDETATLYRTVVEASNEGICLLDQSGRISFLNGRLAEMLGRPAEGLRGERLQDFIEEDPERSQGDAQDPGTRECRLRTDSGRKPWALISRHPVPNDAVQSVGTVIDITGLKLAEEERRQSAERFRAIADYTYDWENWISVDGKLLWVNPAVERITGYSVAECMAMPDFPTPFIAEADREAVARQIGEAVQGSSRNDFEFRVRHKDGHLVWVAASWQPIYDTRGARLGHRSSMRDIAERKQAENALRESEAYLAEAQRLSHTGSWAFDVARAEYVYLSEECLRIFGADPRERPLTKEALFRRTHPEDLDRLKASHVKALREKVDTAVEFRLVMADGTVKHLYSVRHPVVNDAGEVVRLLGTTIDVTERKQAEHESDRLRQLETDLAHINRVSMLGELAASIAHEVGQPLACVVSDGGACLRWLTREVPNLEEAREAAKRIIRDGKRAGAIIARVRALTKKALTPNEKLTLNEIIQDVLALVGDEAKRRNVFIRRQFAADLTPVAGDRVQMQQVVLNLVMNGIEAMSGVADRPRELVITTRSDEPDEVQVTVEDVGTGIDPAALDRIFDPFYTTKPSGMGMGLSICRSIVQAHGGRLWATAREGPGTAFHFTLPKHREGESHA